MSTDPLQLFLLPPELTDLLQGNEAARAACRTALQVAFQAGRDAGWTQGYAEGRAVAAAYTHASGCNLNHPAGEPCEVPLDYGPKPNAPLMRVIGPTSRSFMDADGQQGFRSTSGGQIVTPDTGYTEWTER